VTSHPPPIRPLAGRLGRLFAVVGLLAALTPAWADDEPRDLAFDKDRLYVKNIKDLRPLSLEGGDEREPYEDVLLHAHKFSTGQLTAAARRDVSYYDMMDDKGRRDEVRFELVHLEGRLKRLKKITSLGRLKSAGMPDLYEAWIYPKGGRGHDPICVILSEPPTGLEPADDFTPGVPVSTAGYFFKVIEYPSNQANPADPTRTLFRRAPLLLGHGMTTGKDADGLNASVTDLVTVSLVFGGAVLLGLLGLALWFRRTDAGSRKAYVNKLRNPYTPPPPPTDGPPPDAPPPGTGST
jgi:hypothetical protein